jgi:hypothetical protein
VISVPPEWWLERKGKERKGKENMWAKFALFISSRKLERFSLTAILRRQVVASHGNFGGDEV